MAKVPPTAVEVDGYGTRGPVPALVVESPDSVTQQHMAETEEAQGTASGPKFSFTQPWYLDAFLYFAIKETLLRFHILTQGRFLDIELIIRIFVLQKSFENCLARNSFFFSKKMPRAH